MTAPRPSSDGRRAVEPRAGARTVPAGWGTAVALGASTALLLFAVLTVLTAGPRGGGDLPRAPASPRPRVAAEVDLWVGEVAPGVKAVLSAEWNQPDWDLRSDEQVNAALGGGPGLAFYAFVAFNTSPAPVSLGFGDGALLVVPGTPVAGVPGTAGAAVGAGEAGGARLEPSGPPVPSVDLGRVLADPTLRSSAAATTLRILGADRGTVELPPGKMLRRPVAFPRRVPLEEAAAVRRADGAEFRRRRMRRSEWAGLLGAPSLELIRAL